MRSRKVIVTRKSETVHPEALATHPNVRGLWWLPHGYMLFEFYHPVFERIYDTEPGLAKSARQLDAVKGQTAQAVAEEQKLLWNLYRDFPESSEALMLLVPAQTAFYNFLGRYKRTIAWPSLGCSPLWETAQKIRVAGRLAANISETTDALRTVLEEWSASAPSTSIVHLPPKLAFDDEYFSFECSFSGPCGDATMGLYMVLTETRSLTSLQAVGFFLPEDFSTPFRQIGSAALEIQRPLP